MKIAPPTILSKTVYSAKPIGTKSRRHKLQDVTFMESEDNRMLAEGIIQVSASPWRAQAFVIRTDPTTDGDRIFSDNYSSYVQGRLPLSKYARPA